MGYLNRARIRCPSGLRGFLGLIWKQPLWAIPFALFFGSMFSDLSLSSYWRAYLLSLSFAYSIGFAIWALENFVLPRLGKPTYRGGTLPLSREALAYAITAILGGYVAATFNHFFIMPGFLRDVRAAFITGGFILLFMGLFTGISYAIVFYRQSIERARAVEVARTELARAELRALRAQINPHFLFNTLNSIASLISLNPAAAEDTTTRFADIFRYALTTSERDHTPLGDEVTFLRDYLEIERIRFGDRLRYEVQVEPGLEHVPVPSLLLQPIVENAVKYAISDRTEGGRLKVWAGRDGDLVRVRVEDDGPGMNGARAPGGTGFGLSSVRERLRAAGPPHAIDIASEDGRGTRIEVTLPFDPRSGGAEAPPPS